MYEINSKKLYHWIQLRYVVNIKIFNENILHFFLQSLKEIVLEWVNIYSKTTKCLDSIPLISTKINSKWILHLNKKPKATKLIEERETFLWPSWRFLAMTTKTQYTEGKMYKLDLIKIKNLCSSKALLRGLPWWLTGRESICQCRRQGLNPRSRKIPHAMEQLS